jgi:ABC-type branched-subunit amino acid transport system substrate-binding protein
VSFLKQYVNNSIVNVIVMHVFSDKYADEGCMNFILNPTAENATEAFSKGQYIVTLKKQIDINYAYSIKLNNIFTNRSKQYIYTVMNVSNLTLIFSLTEDKENLLYSFDI